MALDLHHAIVSMIDADKEIQVRQIPQSMVPPLVPKKLKKKKKHFEETKLSRPNAPSKSPKPQQGCRRRRRIASYNIFGGNGFRVVGWKPLGLNLSHTSIEPLLPLPAHQPVGYQQYYQRESVPTVSPSPYVMRKKAATKKKKKMKRVRKRRARRKRRKVRFYGFVLGVI